MTSLVLSRSSSESCSFLLSSFSSPLHDSLSDLPSSSSNVPSFDLDLHNIPPSFLPSQVSSSSLDAPLLPPPQIVDSCSSDRASPPLPPADLSILPLSTPTMHPNLVSTLKSIICPFSSPSQKNDQPMSTVFEPDSTSVPFCAAGTDTTVGFPPLQSLFTASNPAAALFEKKPEQVIEQTQPRHAAIVPIALIQNRRPYRCGYGACNKTFKNPQTLKMHHKTHCTNNGGGDSGLCSRTKFVHSLATIPQSCKAGQNKKIPSRCPICKRAFVGLYELRRHFGRKHSEGEKEHACSKCGKRFYIEVDLRDHQKLCGEPLLCKCGMKFAFKCNLVAHKRTHAACQDEQEQPKYQHYQDAHDVVAMQNAGLLQQASRLPVATKAFFFPGNAEVIPTVGVDVPITASNSTGRLCTSASQYVPSGSHIFHPAVKAEQLSCNPWLASAVLGASRAL